MKKELLIDTDKYLDKLGRVKSFNIKQNTLLMKKIFLYLDKLPNKENIKISDLIWCIRNDYNQIPLCETCNKEVNFKIERANPNNTPYVKKYCNLKCFNNNPLVKLSASTREKDKAPERLQKRIKTIIDKYGSWENRPGKDNFKEYKLKEDLVPELKKNRLKKQRLTQNKNPELLNKDFLISNFLDENKKIKWLNFMDYFKCSGSSPYNYFKRLDIPYSTKNKYSEAEKEINTFIKSLGITTAENDKRFGKEIDILIPEYQLAIEYNGVYWHSFGLNKIDQESKFRNKHLDKTILMENVGYNLLHVREDEYKNKKEIWQSIIRNKLNKNLNKIFARKCTIKELSITEEKDFLNVNHLQGYTPSKIKIGLYFDDVLVSIMTFGKPRYSKDYQYELIRSCSKINTTVIGGSSKLFKYFIKIFNPNNILSYANRRFAHSEKNLYSSLMFKKLENTLPNYGYIKNNVFFHRSNFTKNKLKDLPNYKDTKTEKQIMFENGFRKIYDCGNLKYEWRK